MEDIRVGPWDRPDQYRLLRNLGGGAEGEVWLAELELSEQGRAKVAMKIMKSDLTAQDSEEWRQHGDLLMSLVSPGVVRVRDVFVGPPQHRPGTVPRAPADAGGRTWRYVAMAFVDGDNLPVWLERHPQSGLSERLALLQTAASGLDDLHSGSTTGVPVVHGDVKPGNIVVDDAGVGVLVDLGLARLTDLRGRQGTTPPYAAPELVQGEPPTPASDRFAFASTVVHVLTGTTPPTNADGVDVDAVRGLLRTEPRLAGREALVDSLLGALSEDPGRRPPRLVPWLSGLTASLSEITRLSASSDDVPTVLSSGRTTGPAAKARASSVPSATGRRRLRIPIVAAAATAAVALSVALVTAPWKSDRTPPDVAAAGSPVAAGASPAAATTGAASPTAGRSTAKGTKSAAAAQPASSGARTTVSGTTTVTVPAAGSTTSGRSTTTSRTSQSTTRRRTTTARTTTTTTTTAAPPPPHRVNVLDNWGAGFGHAMCRGTPSNSLSMPGGSLTQTFTVPSGVASIDTVLVQIDPDSRVTAHATLYVNGSARASTQAAAVGDTTFSFGTVGVSAGSTVMLSISFTATYGKIITVYTTAQQGGWFVATNDCPDGAPDVATAERLRSIFSGWST
ncbi:serine/threonine-protein kinase [Kineosporia sp. A_224]|uniref:serine/threonine protein kinase n=1 Tax=Kineosporia sp. A_224 TaxID=1962180 RepID=UPI000B4B878E|nr:serine/threonine-protein kinase [Kineosporia sp. A_224]